MAHVVQGTAEEEAAFERATEKKLRDAGIGGMADIEAQLEELSASELSGTAGGSMTYFLFWDLSCFVAIALFCGTIIACAAAPRSHTRCAAMRAHLRSISRCLRRERRLHRRTHQPAPRGPRRLHVLVPPLRACLERRD